MATFRDISSRSAFAAEIGWVSELGYLRGWGDGSFRPLSTIKRDAMAAVFHRMAGSPDFTAPGRSPFTDVRPGQQFYREMCWARERGLLNGWSDGTFHPLDPIDRNATCALFYRAAGSPAFAAPAHSPFRDLTPRSAFYKEICWARSVGITTGWADGTFRPLESTARNAMAAFIRRFDLAVG